MGLQRAVKWFAFGLAAGCGVLALSGCQAPRHRTFTVDISSDSVDVTPGDGSCADAAGHCSLRAALAEDNSLPVVGMTDIVLTTDVDLSIPRTTDDVSTGDLDVTGHVSLQGNGHVIDGHGVDRVIHQRSGDLAIRNLTVRGGRVTASGGTGGGILAEGNLVLISSSVDDNQVSADGGGGGGIYGTPGSQVVVASSSISENAVDGNGGQNAIGGGVASAGTLTVVDSTLRANTNDGGLGGALFVVGGTARVDGSTLSGNSAAQAGGAAVGAGALTMADSTISGNTSVFLSAISANAGSVDLRFVTIAQNAAPYAVYVNGATFTMSASIIDDPGQGCFGAPITSLGHNLASDAACGLTQPTDQQSIDAQLGPLADNGGPTLTHLPATTSPAIDAIATSTPDLCPAAGGTDQRGQHRPIGFGCDVGSVEVDTSAPLSLVVDSALDGPDASPGDRLCDDGAGHCTLRAAIDETNANPFDDTIAIAAGVDPTLSIAGADEDANATGDLDVLGTLTIHGAGATLDAAHLDRVIDQHAGALTIDGLAVANGSLASGRGGGIQSAPGLSLDLQRTTLRDNDANDPSSGNGGGLFAGPAATVHVADSTISGNVSQAGGGAYIDGVATITGSTFVANTEGGALFLYTGASSVVNSTFSGNTNRFLGSAIEAGGPLELVNSTIVGAGDQAPLYGGSFGSITVRGSIVDMPIFRACYGHVVSQGFNIASDSTCAFTQPTDHEATVPALRALEDNGGPTLTRLPQAGSPAIDAIPSGTVGLCDGSVPTDQRGVARPQADACDIGAVEGSGAAVAPLTYTVDVPDDRHDAAPGDGVCDDGSGHCPLRAAIDESNASFSDDTIVIATGVDPTLSIAGVDEDANATGDLDILGRVTIHGGGATLDAASLDRGLHALAGPVSIDHLTVTHGYAEESGGGIFAFAALSLDHVDLRDNVLWSFDPAGAGLRGFGPTTLVDSSITGNAAVMASGAFLQGTTTMVRTTVSGNTSSGLGPTLFLEEGAATIDDSTISGNTAQTVPGLVIQQGSLVIRNSTISDNVATAPIGSNTYASAVSNFFSSSITIVGSTILADTTNVAVMTGGTDQTTITGSIVTNAGGAACGQPATSGGWNLSSDTTCGLTQPSDHESVDPLLGALGANGGPTATRLPGLGSPAIDAIPVGTAGLCDGTLGVDQRGVIRPQGTACDIGAVEQ